MTARAMWKGVIRFGDERVPVKLYAAIEDRSVHFRLLHEKDSAPVKQAMVNPETDEVVPYGDTRRAFQTDEGAMIMLAPDELESLEPEKSRDIEILSFLPQSAIDHRWYDRPYYLGPDGDDEAYFALASALEASGQEGLAQWVMRNKRYMGALRLYAGYPMLMSLRHAEEVVPASALNAPQGPKLDAKELTMARQLIGMLEAEFKPDEYQDDYRERVMEMIEAKAQGRSVKVTPLKRKKKAEDITDALEASLAAMKKKAS